MKKLLIVAGIVLTAGVCWAVDSQQRDGNNQTISDFAPNGSSQLLTVNKTTADTSSSLRWGIFAADANCKVRYQAAATIASEIQTPIPASTWIVRGVNPKAAFINLSGCTNAVFSKQ